jgi:ribosomal protein L11 methylase PrmA
VQSLRKVVQKLNWRPGGTEWRDYYNITNYSDASFGEKQKLACQFLQKANPKKVWDLGANTGVFSRIAADLNMAVISFDVDPSAVELNYRTVRDKKEERLLPLLLDLTNPSPSLGWNGNERNSLFQRGPTDCIMALALIHHLAISNNLPLLKIAEFFYGLCEYLIIEFVPKEDSQVQKLLSSRVDIFKEYDRTHFESIFSKYFKIHRTEPIIHSERILYLMQRHAV